MGHSDFLALVEDVVRVRPRSTRSVVCGNTTPHGWADSHGEGAPVPPRATLRRLLRGSPTTRVLGLG